QLRRAVLPAGAEDAGPLRDRQRLAVGDVRAGDGEGRDLWQFGVRVARHQLLTPLYEIGCSSAAEVNPCATDQTAARRSRPRVTPRPIMPTASSRCSQLSAVLSGTKFAALVGSTTSP